MPNSSVQRSVALYAQHRVPRNTHRAQPSLTEVVRHTASEVAKCWEILVEIKYCSRSCMDVVIL